MTGCTLTITTATGVLAGSTLTQITASGTSVDCKNVFVFISCGSGQQSTTVPVVGGLWTAVFNVIPSGCGCGHKIDITARCNDGQHTCSAQTTLDLDCGPAPCPTFVGWPTVDTSQPCQADGTRPVTATIGLNGTGAYSATLLANGIPIATVSGPGSTTLSGTVNATGTVVFQVVFNNPAGCAPSPSFSQIVGDCPKCPEVTWAATYSDCDSSGNRSLSVSATLSSSDPFSAALLDANGVIVGSGSGPGALTLSQSSSYPAGTTQQFSVAYSSGGCPKSSLSVALPACTPPNTTDPTEPVPFCPCCIPLMIVVIAYYVLWALGYYAGDLVILGVNLGSVFGYASGLFTLLMLLIIFCYLWCKDCRKCWHCRLFRCLFYALLIAIVVIIVLIVLFLTTGTPTLSWPQTIQALIFAFLAMLVAWALMSTSKCKKFFDTGKCQS